MSVLDRLKSRALSKVEVKLGEETLFVHELDNATASRIQARARNAKGVVNNSLLERLYLAACVHDGDGGLVAADPEAWSGLPAADHVKLVSECLKVNGFTPEETEDPNS